MPFVAARQGVHGYDTGQEQIVAAAGGADGPGPGRAVARAQKDLVEIRIVDDGIPYGAAAAEFPGRSLILSAIGYWRTEL